MKKKLSTVILVLIFILGLSVVLYPTISDYLNHRQQKKVIVNYEHTVSEMDTQKIDEMYAKAVDYNERLAAMGVAGFYSPDRVEGYKEALNISGIGVMGYITIPKINVELPIYHGTSEGVLQIAVGHLEGSSLPIGGEGTHCVLSGHRGLPSANLFTHLDKLDVGDIFTITVLDKVLTYEVDQIRIVEPGEVSELQKVEGKDYCTLLTCTPYGINTHRLLVRGQRVANIEDGTQLYVIADAYKMDTKTVTVIMAIPLTILILIGIFVYTIRKKKKTTNFYNFVDENKRIVFSEDSDVVVIKDKELDTDYSKDRSLVLDEKINDVNDKKTKT